MMIYQHFLEEFKQQNDTEVTRFFLTTAFWKHVKEYMNMMVKGSKPRPINMTKYSKHESLEG